METRTKWYRIRSYCRAQLREERTAVNAPTRKEAIAAHDHAWKRLPANLRAALRPIGEPR